MAPLHADTAAVAAQYDALDPIYREVWGEHLHHGLWDTGRARSETATDRLTRRVIETAGVAPGMAVVDIGCGYGGTARVLAREYGAQVTGVTVSTAQYEAARAHPATPGNPVYRLEDWLDNRFEDGAFDAAIAIESLAHMPDRDRFFTEAFRVLRPGGSIALTAWLLGPRASGWRRRRLVDPLRREVHLAGLEEAHACRTRMANAGFNDIRFDDLTRGVRRSWSVAIGRAARNLLTRRRYAAFLFDRSNPHRGYVPALGRIWLGYRTGAIGYGLFTARRPAKGSGASSGTAGRGASSSR